MLLLALAGATANAGEPPGVDYSAYTRPQLLQRRLRRAQPTIDAGYSGATSPGNSCASVCTTTRLRPSFLARYMAWSACASRRA